MKKIAALCLIIALMLLWGCPGAQPGGQGDGNSNQPGDGGAGSGDDGEDNGDGGAGDGGDDDGAGGDDDGAGDDGGSDGDGGDGTEDGNGDGGPGDDGDDLPVAFRLDGVWDDNGRHIIIEQNGTEVEANYFSERYCHPEDGPSEEPVPGGESTFFDFRGMLNNGEDVLPGDIITGEVNTCRWGFDTGPTGFTLADFVLTVIDENTLSGEYEIDEDGDGEGDPGLFGSFTVTREQ